MIIQQNALHWNVLKIAPVAENSFQLQTSTVGLLWLVTNDPQKQQLPTFILERILLWPFVII